MKIWDYEVDNTLVGAIIGVGGTIVGTISGSLIGYRLENKRNKKLEQNRLRELKIELKSDLEFIVQILLNHSSDFWTEAELIYDQENLSLDHAVTFRDRWFKIFEEDKLQMATIAKIFSKYESYFGSDPRILLIIEHTKNILTDFKALVQEHVLRDLNDEEERNAVLNEAENLDSELVKFLQEAIEDIFQNPKNKII